MSSKPIVYLTRKECFSAAHRLHSPHLSDEVNQQIYGKCNNPNGHGHNYTVEITLRGPVDPQTGMVMNISDLKDHIDHTIMKNLDHKNLDKDVAFFKNTPSTSENVAIYIWESLRARMSKAELLYEVKLYETDKNSVVYRGRHTMGYRPHVQEKRIQNGCTGISSDSD